MGFGSKEGTSDHYSDENVSKLFFKFNYSESTRHQDKISRVEGTMKSSLGFERALQTFTSGSFTTLAGCDISDIFFPYRIASGVSATMPTISVTEYNSKLLPYEIEFDQTDKVFNRLVGPSGDRMGSAVSSDYYLGDSFSLRDADDVRSVGLRLPIMGIGWGKNSARTRNIPSGTTNELYAGETPSGTHVDPQDYIAAPIDFRFDEDRGVWTCGDTEPTTFARITSVLAASGYYYAEEVAFYPDVQQWQPKIPTDYPSGWNDWPGNPNGVLYEIGKFSNRPFGTIVEVKQSTDAYSSGTFWWFENDDNEFWAEIISSWAEDEDLANASGIITTGTNLRDNIWTYVWFPPSTLSDQYRSTMFGTYTLRLVESTSSGVYSVPAPTGSGYIEFEAKNLDEIEFPNVFADTNPFAEGNGDSGVSFWIPSSGQYVRARRTKISNDPNENRDYEYTFNYPIIFNDYVKTDEKIAYFTQYSAYEEGVTPNTRWHLFSDGETTPTKAIAHKKANLILTPSNDDPYWQVDDIANIDASIGVGWLDTADQNISSHPNSGSYGEMTIRSVLYDPESSGMRVYRLGWDDTGHVRLLQDEDTTVSGSFTDIYVAVEGGKTPGYLDDVLDTPDDWLDKTINVNVLELRHEDAQAVADTVDFDIAHAGGTITWTYPDDLDFDAKGHFNNAGANQNFTFDVLPASDPWLEIAGVAGGATIAHIGPDVEDHTDAPIESITSNDGTITFEWNIFSFDSKGHHRAAGAATDTGLINIEGGDDYIDVNLTDEGGNEVSVEISHADPQATSATVTFAASDPLDISSSSGGTDMDFDAKGHYNEANKTITISIDWSEITGWDAGETQVLMNVSGSVKWVTASGC